MCWFRNNWQFLSFTRMPPFVCSHAPCLQRGQNGTGTYVVVNPDAAAWVQSEVRPGDDLMARGDEHCNERTSHSELFASHSENKGIEMLKSIQNWLYICAHPNPGKNWDNLMHGPQWIRGQQWPMVIHVVLWIWVKRSQRILKKTRSEGKSESWVTGNTGFSLVQNNNLQRPEPMAI